MGSRGRTLARGSHPGCCLSWGSSGRAARGRTDTRVVLPGLVWALGGDWGRLVMGTSQGDHSK